jgi:hypothetical protein
VFGAFVPKLLPTLVVLSLSRTFPLTKFRTTHRERVIEHHANRSLPFSVQVELNLKKSDGKSWTVLEKTTRDLGGFQLTFGVGGRTGTIGAKEIIVDPSIQAQSKSQ